MRRPALPLLPILVLAALLAPTVAEGHYKGVKEFYFGPITSNQDPVNMFYQPWATSKEEVDRHQKAHWRTDPQGERECANDRDAGGGRVPGDGSCDRLKKLRWHTDEQMSSRFGFCKGTDTLDFEEFGGGRVRLDNDWQSAGYSTDRREEPDNDIDVGPEDCLTRYHNRMWDDETHQQISRTPHDAGYEQWVVGGVHHETPEVECTIRPATPPVDDFCVAAGHDIDLDWDAVEFTFFQVMRRDAGPRHVDRDATSGTRGGHCAVYRWRGLPDSEGLIQQFNSDGMITRISMSHCPAGPNTAP